MLAVPRFLVEAYLPRTRARELSIAAGELRRAVDAAAAGGATVRYVRSTFVPEDELCVHVVEAASIDAARAALARAAIRYERLVEAVESL